MDNSQRVLRRPFDVETHKKTFVNYLEIIIDEGGVPMYAVPSHQEKLIAMACEKLGMDRDELNDACPPEYYFDFMAWLCEVSKGIAVWGEMTVGTPNDRQRETLRKLQESELYFGPIR